MRRTTALLWGVYDFVDPTFIASKRPLIPGGAWKLEILRKKSVGDLQQIWFALLKERNMLATMKSHYLRHTEELGALPAPSRIKMVQNSLDNVTRVMRERDNEATDKAVAIFKERLARGIYRYPPGPQLPPGWGDCTSTVCVTLSARVDEEVLRDVFGMCDVYESHKGIARVEMSLPEAVLEQRRVAEAAYDSWRLRKSDFDEYHKYDRPSYYDQAVEVELAPQEYLAEPVVAYSLPVPSPKPAVAPPADTLARLQWEARPSTEKMSPAVGLLPQHYHGGPSAARGRTSTPGRDRRSVGGPHCVRPQGGRRLRRWPWGKKNCEGGRAISGGRDGSRGPTALR